MDTDPRIRVLELRSVRGTGGGPEKTIMLGAAHADRDRFDITVCYIRDRRDLDFQPAHRASRLGITYLEAHERHSFDPAIWPTLRRIVSEHRIDIVHAHEYKTDFLALLLAKRTGIIPLATAHGWTGNSVREQWVYYPLDKRLLARFPRVVAVSGDIRDDLVRHGADPRRVTVLLNAVDPAAFRRSRERRNVVRSALGFGAADVVVGSVGRLERQKRYDLLLEAFAELARTRPDLRLAIAGDGRLRGELSLLAARLGVADRFHFLGHRHDVAEVHHAFDVFVQSSEYEGTPNAVLEAMAMETPLVATDVGGTKEVAGPGTHGLIVPKHDVPALSAAINEVLTDVDRTAARVAAARRRVEEDLSFANRTRRLEAIYAELARPGHPATSGLTPAAPAGLDDTRSARPHNA
jgi:glycosyltransferase involved in cell wall biosynthesis